jgi:hypothetical protein
MAAPAPDAETALFLRVCEGAIAETQQLIRELEACDMPRGQKRRHLLKLRSRLGQIECAAERVRIAGGAE